jgi:ribosome biogenesis GTPase
MSATGDERFGDDVKAGARLALERLGWDPAWQSAASALAIAGGVPGRIALEHNHVYRVLTWSGEHLAETAGRLKHRAAGRRDLPAVGDWVVIRPDPRGGRALIQAVLPRRSCISRRAAGRETTEQVVAANIDVIFVVFGLDKPLNPRAIERYLLVAERGGARPVVVLNKADLRADAAAAVAELQGVLPNVSIHAVSAHDGAGLGDLERYVEAGRTLALLGPSGAGKSSLVNRLIGREVLPTGEVRPWDARGRHTSVHRQLVLREGGGLVIDTPGMRELQLWDVATAGAEAFSDIAGLAERCKFRDCRHDREPGCAVKAAVQAGTLDADRYEGFLKLQREEQQFEQRVDEHEQIKAKRQARVMGKSLKAMQKARGR